MPEARGIAYEVHDDGGAPEGQPPLLLIHGAGGNRLYWPPQIRRLAGVRVYAVDLPAHGQSGGRPQSTISGYAEGVIDWMRAVGVHKAVLAGHSMGGAIALTIALRVPRRLAGLALLGTSAKLGVDPRILNWSASRADFPQAVDRVVGAAFSRGADENLVRLAKARMLEAEHSTFHADFQACAGFNVSSRLSEIALPALVICGQDDRLVPPSRCAELAEALPASTLRSVERAGHMVMLERPEEVAAELLRYLRSGLVPRG